MEENSQIPEEADQTPSEEELTIVRLLGQGLTDKVVVARTGLSTRTYRRRLASIMAKLGARSRFEAGARAAQKGWLDATDTNR